MEKDNERLGRIEQSLENLHDEVSDIKENVEDINQNIHNINVILSGQASQLAEHMRRTDALEKIVDILRIEGADSDKRITVIESKNESASAVKNWHLAVIVGLVAAADMLVNLYIALRK